MASFPTLLDDFPDPADETAQSGNVDPLLDHATQHTNANDALEAIENKVGVDNGFTGLDAKVNRLAFDAEPAPRVLDDSIAFFDASAGGMRKTSIDSLFTRLSSWRVEEEFGALNFSGVTAQTSGTGAAIVGVAGTADHPGVVQGSTGTTTTGRAGLYGESASYVFGGGRMRFTSIVRVTTLSSAGEAFAFRSGFGDSVTGAPVDGALFRYTHSENSGRWVCVARANNVETVVNTDIPVVAGTWYHLEVEVNAAGSSVAYRIGVLGAAPVLVGTITTNIPVGAGRETGVLPANMIKSAGTTARTWEIDFYSIRGELAPSCTPGAPLAIPDLRLWLKADGLLLADGDSVTTWDDWSGNDFNFTQATASKKPTYVANVINGKPVVRFDGTNDLLTGAAGVSSATQGTVFIVASRSASGTERVLLASADEASTTRYAHIGKNATEHVFVGQVDNDTEDRVRATNPLTTGAFYMLEVTSTDTAFEISIRRNGVLEAPVVDSGSNNGDWFAATSARDNFTIGALKRTTEANFWQGDVAEVIVYDHAVTELERASVEYYLNAKYAITDPGTPSGTDPLDFAGLLYWFKADAVGLSDGAAVATWPDSSGNGRHLTQATGANQPTYKTNIVNGKPVVRFDGVTERLRSATFADEPQPNTLFVVLSRAAFATPSTAVTGLDANHHNSIQVTGSSFNKLTYAAPDAKNDGGLAANTFYVVSAIFNGATSKLFNNGAEVTPAGVGPGTQGFIGVHMGSSYTEAANWFNGDIAEYIFYDSSLSDGDRRSIESYLGAKYGITVV